MQKLLKAAVGDDLDHELEDLKQKLLKLYLDRSDAINRQNNYGVLAYLRCCDGRGPSQQLMNNIKSVSTSQHFKKFFLPAGSVIVVDEDQEDEYDDTSDAEYFCSENSDDLEQRKVTGSQRIVERQSGPHETELPPDVSSSQESGELEEGPQKKVLSLVNALKHVSSLVSQNADTLERLLSIRQSTLTERPLAGDVTGTVRYRIELVVDTLQLIGGLDVQEETEELEEHDTIELSDD